MIKMRDNKPKGKTTGRNPAYKKPLNNKAPRPERRRDEEKPGEDSENMVFGRNSVMEAIRSGRTVDKLFVAKGDREGSIVRVIAMAKENGITVVEAEKAKLDSMTRSASHQGVVAITTEFSYCEPEDILAYAAEKEEKGYCIHAGDKEFHAIVVVNAAGVYADVIHNMVCEDKIKITPRRGEYCLFDKTVGDLVERTIFQLPSTKGKGILVTPTVHGNLLAGPTAEDISDKEGVNTTEAGLEQVLKVGAKSVKSLPVKQVITSFSGLRAHEERGDFIIGEAKETPGFFDVAGIASPGLTSAPAIGVYVAELINEKYPAPVNKEFIPTRKGIPNMAEATVEERKELVRQNPAYANVICRCELVTEGEIVDAIRRPLGATTLDGVKRRTRAGMGRCQSGFCSPKVVEILARELGVDSSRIRKSGNDSSILTGYNKGGEA